MTPKRVLATKLLLASVLGLNACTVGPDYWPPEISTVSKERFREDATSGVTSANPASSAWWDLYSDPTLSRLIEDAFPVQHRHPRGRGKSETCARAILGSAPAACPRRISRRLTLDGGWAPTRSERPWAGSEQLAMLTLQSHPIIMIQVSTKPVSTALARYETALEQNAALARPAESVENAADQTRQRFDLGRDNFLTLLVAEQNRAPARQALAQSDTHVADFQVSLFKALGGGWENAPLPADVPPTGRTNRDDEAIIGS